MLSAALEVALALVAGDGAVEELLLGARVVEVVVDDLVAERDLGPSSPVSSAAIASRSACGKRSASDSYALPSSGGGGSSPCSIPCRPAAITAANARYGLTSPPGIRVSTRRAFPCPTTRNPHVRLSFPHASVVGAQLPAA